MANSSNSIKQFITQSVLIVFSVVLGLYLSERIEDRKKRQESDELLTTIKAEVQDNYGLLKDWSPYHEEINTHLDSLSGDDGFIEEFVQDRYSLLEHLLTRGTLMARRPASDAWDIAKSHPLVVNLDYDKWVILSRIYNQQALTFEPALQMIELLESKDVNIEENARANLTIMSNHIREFVARERQLLSFYREAEGILDLNDDEEVQD